jgi:hypothetical protein
MKNTVFVSKNYQKSKLFVCALKKLHKKFYICLVYMSHCIKRLYLIYMEFINPQTQKQRKICYFTNVLVKNFH